VANPTIILVRRNATAREIYDAIWQRSKVIANLRTILSSFRISAALVM
jgi:hypothetical protein